MHRTRNSKHIRFTGLLRLFVYSPNKRHMSIGRRIVWLRFVPACFFIGLFLFGAVELGSYLIASGEARSTNAQLAKDYEVAASLTDSPHSESQLSESTLPSEAAEAYSYESSETNDNSPLAYQAISDTILPQMREMLKMNPDTVAWIQIPGVLSLPVVYRDNEYYLTHDFKGKQSDAGTLFLDEMHPLAEDTQYMVIHGHNMYDGSMFAMITHYRKKDFCKVHMIVDVTTLYKKEQYLVFAVAMVDPIPDDPFFASYTGRRSFLTEEDFNIFINQIYENALYRTPIQVNANDSILALSTCYKDKRCIVFLRRLRENPW